MIALVGEIFPNTAFLARQPRTLAARKRLLDVDWLSLPPAEGFQALSALPADAKQRLFAWCIAGTLNPQLAVEDRADPVVECAFRSE
jgi:hypothetical protein